jgi:hypothetical protein
MSDILTRSGFTSLPFTNRVSPDGIISNSFLLLMVILSMLSESQVHGLAGFHCFVRANLRILSRISTCHNHVTTPSRVFLIIRVICDSESGEMEMWRQNSRVPGWY